MSKLSEVAVSPKPIERQRVSTCLQVFSAETINVFQDITFLSIMVEFGKIVNVHSPC